MITIKKEKNQPLRQDKNYVLVEVRGLSTDEKPKTCYDKNIANGSVFIEINTGKMFMFDLSTETWKEV